MVLDQIVQCVDIGLGHLERFELAQLAVSTTTTATATTRRSARRRDDLTQFLEGVVEAVHTAALPGVGSRPTLLDHLHGRLASLRSSIICSPLPDAHFILLLSTLPSSGFLVWWWGCGLFRRCRRMNRSSATQIDEGGRIAVRLMILMILMIDVVVGFISLMVIVGSKGLVINPISIRKIIAAHRSWWWSVRPTTLFRRMVIELLLCHVAQQTVRLERSPWNRTSSTSCIDILYISFFFFLENEKKWWTAWTNITRLFFFPQQLFRLLSSHVMYNNIGSSCDYWTKKKKNCGRFFFILFNDREVACWEEHGGRYMLSVRYGRPFLMMMPIAGLIGSWSEFSPSSVDSFFFFYDLALVFLFHRVPLCAVKGASSGARRKTIELRGTYFR